MSNMAKDERFSRVASDPKFRHMKRKHRIVRVDKRFKGMFKDKDFKLKYTVDKRGRPVQATTNEDLRRFYDISDGSSTSDDDEEGDDEEDEEEEKQQEEGQSDDESAAEDDVTESIGSNQFSHSGRKPANQKDNSIGVDLARGEGNESSTDDDVTSDDNSEAEHDYKWGELDHDAPRVTSETRRLAVCNMDWDRIKAQSLLVLFSSFKPVGGTVKSVTIYPSEFGKARMAKEEMEGPAELLKRKRNSDDEDDFDAAEHEESLRQYQLNRLKYFYAVVDCDSAATANAVYEECDGLEFETTSNKIDLRFIPNDMEFGDEPKDVATELPAADKYKPEVYKTSALQHSKVELTWDEDDQDRVAVTMKKVKAEEVDSMDVAAYLATDSESEGVVEGEGRVSDEEEDAADDVGDSSDVSNVKRQIKDYKKLLFGAEEEKKKAVDMEVTWEPGLKEAVENDVKKHVAAKESSTPWEQYLLKRKEKKKEKRTARKHKLNEELNEEDSDDVVPHDVDLDDPYFAEEFVQSEAKSLKSKVKKSQSNKINRTHEQPAADDSLKLLLDDEDDGKKHFNMKAIVEDHNLSKTKRKKKRRKMTAEENADAEDDFKVNVTDSRFAELYTNPQYHIDPSSADFKKTKAMEEIITEKQKRRCLAKETISKERTKTMDAGTKKQPEPRRNDLGNLVKSVKLKTQGFNKKKRS